MAKWTKESITILIHSYKDCPELYNPNHPNYHCPLSRAGAETKIARIVSTIRPNTGCDDVRRKMHTLRNSYNIEREVTKAAPSYIPYEPQLWYYGMLTFLDEFFTLSTKNTQKSFTKDDNNDVTYKESGSATTTKINSNTNNPSPNNPIVKATRSMAKLGHESESISRDDAVGTDGRNAYMAQSNMPRHKTINEDFPMIYPCYDYARQIRYDDRFVSNTSGQVQLAGTYGPKNLDVVYISEASPIITPGRDVNKPRKSIEIDETDDTDKFGASIAVQLKKICNDYARSLAKLQIQRALFDAEVFQNRKTLENTMLTQSNMGSPPDLLQTASAKTTDKKFETNVDDQCRTVYSPRSTSSRKVISTQTSDHEVEIDSLSVLCSILKNNEN